MFIRSLIITCLVVLLPLMLVGQNRFWVASSAASWSSDSWASSSGAAADGAGPPSGAANARFDANGLGNCNIDIAVSISGLIVNGYTGTIDLNDNTFTTSGTVTLSSGTINDNSGNDSLVVNSTANTTCNGTTFGAIAHFSSTNVILNGSTFNNRSTFIKTGGGNSTSTGNNVFNGRTIISHTGAGGNWVLGNSNPDDFNGFTTISSSGSGGIFMAHTAANNTFDGDLEVECSGSASGIFFGNNNGSSTLSDGNTITIGGAGYSTGTLRFRNFTKVGAAALTLTTTGTTLLDSYNSSWGGNITFTSPRLSTRGSTFNGTTSLTKTSVTNDASVGGNHFLGDFSMTATGSGYFLMGNGTADTFDLDVSITNAGTNNSYIAHAGSGHYIGGNVSITNSASGNSAHVYLSTNTDAGLTIDGNVTISNTGSATTNNVLVGDNGDVTIGGTLDINNNGSGTTGQIYLGVQTNSAISVAGATTANNLASGGSTHRIYLGNNGDVTFDSTVTIVNSSTATNSQVYLNHSANSSNTYSGNLTLTNSNASSDGILFGSSGGSGVLAANRTISIGAGGFVAGSLTFRNFTQTGATDQNITVTGTTTLTIYDAFWGGNISFAAPRFTTRGTTYSGNFSVEKTGANNDNSNGGNTIAGNTILTCSGSGYLLMGQNEQDTFSLDVTMNNIGSSNLYIAHNAAGNYIGGNLVATNASSGTSSVLYLAQGSNGSLTVEGTSTFTQNSSATTNTIIAGDQGDITFKDAVTATGNGSGTTSQISFANNTNSLVTFESDLTGSNTGSATTVNFIIGNNGDVNMTGNLDLQNSNAATNTQLLIANGITSAVSITGTVNIVNGGAGNTHRSYLGNNGDITIVGDITIENSSSATNSEVYFNHAANSVGSYDGNISVTNSNASGDGVLWGASGGFGTLAATHTITIGAAGFSAGQLHFRNFTQTGATAQSITLTGTALLVLYDADWGGDVTFIAPRFTTRGTTFQGTAVIEKTAGSGDSSNGGNKFLGITTLTNSGSGAFTMGNGTADTFSTDIAMINTGSANFNLAQNGTDHFINGNLTMTHSTTGSNTQMIASNSTAASLTVTGNVLITHNSSATTSNVYLGSRGDVTVNGSVTLTNAATGTTTGQVFIASESESQAVINGKVSVTNSSSSTTARVYVGNAGDVSIVDSLIINNNSTTTNSEVFCNYRSQSVNSYGNDIVVTSTSANCDGVSFGQNGGSSTLAAGQTISIGNAGYIGGNLYLRNFTQLGNTAQTLSISGTGILYNYDSDWGGNVSFTGPRIITRGTAYAGTAYLEKTGAVDDQSAGGNTFAGETEIANSGTRYILMGNGSPDTFNLNLTLNNTSSRHIYLGHNSAGNYIAGNLIGINAGTGTDNQIRLCEQAISSLTVDGNTSFTNSSSASSSGIYVGLNGDITLNGDLDINNSPTGASGLTYLANGSTSEVSIAGVTTVSNNGSSTTNRVILGVSGDVTFNDSLTITNNSSATNSEVFCNHGSSSNNTYNGHITVNSTHASCDGVIFGQNEGSGTLAATYTVAVGGGGFIGGSLNFRNFTQVGATPQTASITGTGYIYHYDSDWGGNVSFTSPRMLTRGTNFQGTAYLEKTGASDDQSAGGNSFTGDVQLVNSGSGYLMMGNGTADTFGANVQLTNSGTRHLYLGYNGAGNTIAGNLTVLNSGSGTDNQVRISEAVASTVSITGTASFTNTSSATSSAIYLGLSGDMTFGSSVNMTNAASGNSGQIIIGNGSTSTTTIAGNTTLSNSGSSTTHRSYLGNQGDVTFNGTLDITNSASATNSEVYCNYGSSSVNTYNQNITVSVTNASCDGIYFGNNAGSGTLAATRTITVGGGGYSAGFLYFRNFTQVGATDQALTLTGTGYIQNYDANWGGNVTFIAPRHNTRGTTYSGTAYLEKTGATDDGSAGGNAFTGNVNMVNSGSGSFRMGNGTADTFGGNLDINCTGTNGFYIAQNSAGNTIAGDLNVRITSSGTSFNSQIASASASTLTVSGATTILDSNSAASSDLYIGEQGDVAFNGSLTMSISSTGASGNLYLANNANSTVTVGGPLIATNDASGTTKRLYIGNSGDVAISSTLTVSNTSTANTGEVYIGSGGSSAVSISGAVVATNSGGGITKRMYLGNAGDVAFGSTLQISNNSSSTNSQVYLNHNSSSTNTYAGNISLENTNASGDGILFGSANGTGTLAASRTVSILGGGFVAGQLQFRNFTQTGATAQNLTLTGTALFYNYNSNWGGDVIFAAPRMLTLGTNYSGSTYLEKSGATNDQSSGGNSFTGNTILVNSGSGNFLMGNGTADTFGANVSMNNTGTYRMQLATNGSGTTIGGNLTINNSPTGTSSPYVYVGVNNNADVTIAGNVTATVSGSASNPRLYLGNNGDINIAGNLSVTNTATGTQSYLYVGNGTNSAVSVTGKTTATNSGGSTTKQLFLGNNGDITFGDSLIITNNSSANNSQIYLNHTSNSVNVYNGHIVVENTDASGDGVYFGLNGGSGTLAANQTINIGAGGFVSGQLYFRNFIQTGATAQNLTLTGTGYLFHYDNDWGGDVNFVAPRMYTRGTIYQGTASLEKSGATNDGSPGGNTFEGDATFTNSGTGYFLMANGTTDDHNGHVTYVKTSTGLVYPAYNATSTYAGNLNFDFNTTVTYGNANGVVQFDGTGAQSINDLGSSPEPLFERIVLNNPNSEITLNTPITITAGSIAFTQGNLVTDSINLLTMNDNTTVSGVSNDSFVDGPIEKVGNDAFTFPVGDLDQYRPISISAPAAGSSRFRATYYNANPNDSTYYTGSRDAGLENVSSREYWILDRTNGSNSVNVTLSWDTNSGGVDNLSDLRVARWNGSQWVDHGNGGTTGDFTSGTVVSSAPITSFSPFTNASSTTNNTLPIELLDFTATEKGETVDIEWVTATEINNDFFTVERSVDGVHFEAIGHENGAGNSSRELWYGFTDEEPLSGTSYYRLKQTDFDGQYSYSPVERITRNNVLSNRLDLYPNPSDGREFTLEFELAGSWLIEVRDLQGRLHHSIESDLSDLNTLTLIPDSPLPAGAYLIRMISKDRLLSEKMIVR